MALALEHVAPDTLKIHRVVTGDPKSSARIPEGSARSGSHRRSDGVRWST